MEDNTRDALDELAALFLSDPPQAQDQAEPREQGADWDDLGGPGPIRLDPTPARCDRPGSDPPSAPSLRLHREEPAAATASSPGAVHPGPTSDGRASLADSMLDGAIQSAIEGSRADSRSEGGEDPPAQNRSRSGRKVGPELHVEGVVLGNLPGLSGPWLTQYAQHLAQQRGPVAVVHADEQAEVELVQPLDRPALWQGAEDGGSRLGSTTDSPAPEGKLLQMIRRLTGARVEPVRTVLIHLAPEASEQAADRLGDLPSWALLCGGDDAAVVSGYRLIKQRVERDPEAAHQRVSVRILGSDQQGGRSAADKLSGAAEEFLHTPLTWRGAQRQMMPVNARSLGRMELDPAAWTNLIAWMSEPVEPRRGEGRPVSPPTPSKESETEAPASPASPEAEARVSESTPAAMDSPSAADEPDLAPFLLETDDLSGGVALEARCPHQPRTQLVLDREGRLHLLRRQAPATGADETTAGLRIAIVDLLEARKWVREHLQLLQLTCREARFDAGADPVLHLFTDRAEMATGLVARLGKMLKLHLLQQIRVGEQSTWFSTPLS